MEYYIYDIPVFVISPVEDPAAVPILCQDAEDNIPKRLFKRVEVVYVGEFPELSGRNALYTNGGIFISSSEPTSFDMLEDLLHELAHSLEEEYGADIYDDSFQKEFIGKRHRLYHLLSSEGYHTNPMLFSQTEYNEKFDKFLADEVGYPILLNLTMGLFVSPYGATSINEYFANGFEKYFLEGPRSVKQVSPVLYQKIENILNDEA